MTLLFDFLFAFESYKTIINSFKNNGAIHATSIFFSKAKFKKITKKLIATIKNGMIVNQFENDEVVFLGVALKKHTKIFGYL